MQCTLELTGKCLKSQFYYECSDCNLDKSNKGYCPACIICHTKYYDEHRSHKLVQKYGMFYCDCAAGLIGHKCEIYDESKFQDKIPTDNLPKHLKVAKPIKNNTSNVVIDVTKIKKTAEKDELDIVLSNYNVESISHVKVELKLLLDMTIQSKHLVMSPVGFYASLILLEILYPKLSKKIKKITNSFIEYKFPSNQKNDLECRIFTKNNDVEIPSIDYFKQCNFTTGNSVYDHLDNFINRFYKDFFVDSSDVETFEKNKKLILDICDIKKYSIVNASRFSCEWNTKFIKENTIDCNFTGSKGNCKVKMMCSGASVSVIKTTTELSALYIPLKDPKYCAIFIKKNKQQAHLLREMRTNENIFNRIHRLLQNPSEHPLNGSMNKIQIPMMSLHHMSDIGYVFQKLEPQIELNKDVCITHTANISLNENGIGNINLSNIQNEKAPNEKKTKTKDTWIGDSPFVFAIRCLHTRQNLYLGLVDFTSVPDQ